MQNLPQNPGPEHERRKISVYFLMRNDYEVIKFQATIPIKWGMRGRREKDRERIKSGRKVVGEV